MSNQPVTLMLELRPDECCAIKASGRDILDVVRILDTEVSSPRAREWFADGPISELNHMRLRWLLMSLRRSNPCRPARLTWRERITGRLSL